jgi:phage tail sheath protein FI
VRTEWRDLALRHRALRIVEALAQGTRWAALQPRSAATWDALRQQASRFLADCAAAGWLADGEGPPWYVKCDADTHGRGAPLAFVAGLRLQPGGGYVAFRFEQALSGCRVTETGWQPGPALAN